MKKIVYLILATVLLCVVATGCEAMQPIEELYQLPQLPGEYTHLETQIDALLKEGAQYAAPVSGSNLQAVQMVDLDGDGNQEALVFLRNETQEKPLEIHIFDNDGDDFNHTDTIYGNGTQIYSVSYQDFNQDGHLELIVGWRVSAEVQALSVYTLEEDGPRELMTSDYVRYIVTDLNADGVLGIVVLRADSEGQGDGVAAVYQWKDESMAMASSASLSITMGELSQQGRVTQGVLQDGRTAVFVTGVTADGLGVVDVLIWEDELLKNVVFSSQSGVSSLISPFLSLYPADMNGDGVTEVPVAVAMPNLYEEFGLETSLEYCIDWIHLNSKGEWETAMTTYHHAEQGWYLVLPTDWMDVVTVERYTVDVDEATTVFYRMVEDETGMRVAEAFMRISYLTGDNREYNAVGGNHFVLSRQTSAIITAEFYDANASWATPLNEDSLRNAFYTITAEWKLGDS